MAAVTVCEANVEDCAELFRLSMELMEFENIADKCKTTVDSIRRDGFGNKRRFACLVAEDQSVLKSGSPIPIGILLYTWMYKAGRCGHVMHMEQLYITDKYRRQGIGTMLFVKALQLASEDRLLRIQLLVKNSNIPALDFYKRLGGNNVTESPGWNAVRVYGNKIKEYLERLDKSQLKEPGSIDDGESTVSDVTSVRDACVEDSHEIFRLMKEIAEYESEGDRFKTDIESIRKNCFGDKQNFHCLVVEETQNQEKPRLIGFLLYTWLYKIMLGSAAMHIENVFVTEQYRGKGVETALFEQAMKTAKLQDYNGIQLTVRKSNTSATSFYKKFGAVDASEDRGLNYIIFENL